MAVQIAHAVRIDAAASSVERLWPLVTGDYVLLAAYSPRVPVAVEPTPIDNRNRRCSLRSADGRRKRHCLCADDRQAGRERDTSNHFSHFVTVTKLQFSR